jgi:hypothetical protein
VEEAILLELGGVEGAAGFVQRFAGAALWSDRPVLAGALPAARPARAAGPQPSRWTTTYDGPGWIEGRLQRIVAALGEDGSRRVVFEDGETFDVAADGGTIRRCAGPRLAPPGSRTIERALGAPTALALAARGVYLLHASAVRAGPRPLALAAPTGSGKSTLAAAAARRGLARLADDQLPVRLAPDPALLPHFPQLKVPFEEAYPQSAPPSLPFGALLEIAHAPETPRARIERLPSAHGALALSRATVAARLFDASLLAAHFDACARAAATLPVARLEFPSGLDRLGEAVEALAAFAESLG